MKIMICGKFLNSNLLRSMYWRPGLNTKTLEHDITCDVCIGEGLYESFNNAE